jgi:hypothetical protein
VSERARRWGSIALIVGGLVWTISWFMSGLRDDAVLGLEEGRWRALLNPALVLLAGGIWVYYMRLASAAAGLGLLATAIVELGLVGMLVGNVLEFGLLGEGFLAEPPDLFVPAALVTIAGLLLLGVAIVRTGVVPRQSSVPFAGGLAAFVAGAMWVPLFGLGWLLWGYVLLAAPPVEVPTEYR